ncbi:MAG: hypothetical protein HY216_16860 [Candidatus Rokubacteria bacterium]|nr:hypothetical protein [Candidatus Rokubacteria bacterium]
MAEGAASVPLVHRVIRANRRLLVPMLQRVQLRALRAAATEQGLDVLARRLAAIVPDLSDQYSTLRLETPFVVEKVRIQHAFQIRLALRAVGWALDDAPSTSPLRIVDIGDSSGTHQRYLRALLADDERAARRAVECTSVNLDPAAVQKIQARGLPAIHCRAERLRDEAGIDADVFVCFQMLEHLPDPIAFLDPLSRHSDCRYLVITVPWLRRSRVGLHHIRHRLHHAVYPEDTHIFELAPDDWRLVFWHAGWEPVAEEIYRQYPRRSPLRITGVGWRMFDFEGFYGVVLRRNRHWANCYQVPADAAS